ncbi:MAG: hypothetical protein AAGI48_05715 [Verrucomicrobiota bacterium]
MSPQVLLSLLTGAAVAAGGIIQGHQWKRGAAQAGNEELEDRIMTLENELEILKRENESLRSLAQGGGELKVPAEFIDFVADAMELDFRSNPVVHRIAPEELRGRVTASVESRFPPHGLDDRQKAWALMGFLNPDDRFAPQLAATRSIGARSWFDDQTGEGWVTDRFEESSIPDQAALIRVLVRVLLHQHYPPEPGYPGDEADRARNALHHGCAMAIENRFLARQALGIGFAGSQDTSDARDLLASLPVYINGLATFPSLRGTPKAERLMGAGELPTHLHEPPRTTAWFFPGADEVTTQDVVLPKNDEEAVLEESTGMLGLQLWLQTLDPELTGVAEAWRGDLYRLSAGEDGSLKLVWDIALKDAAAADELLESACIMAGMLAQAEQDPSVGEAVTGPEGRRLRASKTSPTTIRFENLPPAS